MHQATSANKINSTNDQTIKTFNLDDAIYQAQQKLLHLQSDAGYWVFALETDCSIPAEYILMMHHVGDIDQALQSKIATYLRSHQSKNGSYPLYTGGEGNISTSVKVYYALKLAGDAINSPHMLKLKDYILNQGGAAKTNVFTRITLATFGQLPWRGVPYLPIEIMLLPKWFPFHLDKVSYWSRAVIVPLLILCTFRATAKNQTKSNILELFVTHPNKEQHYFPEGTLLNNCFLAMDKLGRVTRRFYPKCVTNLAVKRARNWIIERLNGKNGLGAIFPAMVGSYEALLLLNNPQDRQHTLMARQAIDALLVIRQHDAYCQPCLSPVWDTGLAALALQEADLEGTHTNIQLAYKWLKNKQLHNEPGDWRTTCPDTAGGGWAFQFENPHYPDVDDTAMVAFAMSKSDLPDLDKSLHRATRWIVGMQSKNGGYGAFDVDNTYYYLDEIPFADHGALLDPPTADVSARCAMLLAYQVQKHPEYQAALDRTLDYLRSEQEANGSWFGRWGTNYIYGTWSVLIALEQTNIAKDDILYIQAVKWLKNAQNEDGGWGESNRSYEDDSIRDQPYMSTAFQTAWAILGLIAAGEVNSLEVKAGIDFLLAKQQQDGVWNDECFTAPGFPKVFYLKYHGYDKFFPLWALARYRNKLKQQ